MMYRILGALLVMVASSAVGFSIAASYRKEIVALFQLIRGLEFMKCELEFRCPPLPELCCATAMQVNGPVRRVFQQLTEALQAQLAEEPYACMCVALQQVDNLPEKAGANLRLLGKTLGRFDLQGQLSGIETVTHLCRRDLDGMQCDEKVRSRSYRTLGICAGVALVILFI